MSPLFLGEEEYSRRTFFNHYLSSVSSKGPWISPGFSLQWAEKNILRGQGSSFPSSASRNTVHSWNDAPKSLLWTRIQPLLQAHSPVFVHGFQRPEFFWDMSLNPSSRMDLRLRRNLLCLSRWMTAPRRTPAARSSRTPTTAREMTVASICSWVTLDPKSITFCDSSSSLSSNPERQTERYFQQQPAIPELTGCKKCNKGGLRKTWCKVVESPTLEMFKRCADMELRDMFQ